jgi:hypothetical protein
MRTMTLDVMAFIRPVPLDTLSELIQPTSDAEPAASTS